jgi:acyl carrier protein
MTIANQVAGAATTARANGSADTKARVRDFIVTNFYVARPEALADDASLLDSGVVDSTGVLEVISFLEGEFGVSVQDDEIVPENLDSIERIAAYVHRKQG